MPEFLSPETAPERLSLEDEQVLARRIQNRTKGWRQARLRFWEANLGLVIHIVKNDFRKFRLPSEDKIQEGNLGLMRAVEGFQPDRGPFKSYAGAVIRRAILRACREQSTVVKVPEHVHVGVHLKGKPAPAALQDTYPVFEDDLSAEEELDEAESARERVTAFKAHVRELLGLLTEKEQLIVSQRLGLDGKQPRQQKEIGEQFKISGAGVSMAERIAIRKLLSAVGGEWEEPPHDAALGSYAALFTMIEKAQGCIS